jgi:hypothetical protein
VAYLCTLYKDPAQPTQIRIEAARAAARFERPQLAQIDQTTHTTNFVVQVPQKFGSVEEWSAFFSLPTSEPRAPNSAPPHLPRASSRRGRTRPASGCSPSMN